MNITTSDVFAPECTPEGVVALAICLGISELLPLISTVPQNGVLHTIALIAKKVFTRNTAK